MKEANKRNVPFVVIIGADEVKEGKYTLKDMTTSQQQTLSKEEILNILG